MYGKDEDGMTPHILNLQVRPRGATELCAPDVHYVTVGEDSVIAFDANTLVAVEISKAQHQALALQRAVPEGFAAGLLFSKRRPKFDLSPDVSCRQLTLHLSDQCNLRCKYCWIAKDDAEPPVMTRDIASAALRMFPGDGRDLRIGFFGGEPLMHFGMLSTITEMAQRLAEMDKRRAVFHVTTNATLVTPIVARFLAKHGFSIIVSCDGTPRLHDEARGTGSYAAMRRGLSRLHRAGCSGRIVLRGTWSGMPADVLARLGALNELCDQGLAAGVALEPVAGAAYGHTLDAEIRSACNWFGARARSGAPPRWQYLEKTLRRILWQEFRPSECGAGRGYYSVGPTGLIYACHKQQNSHIGIAWPQVVIDEVLRGQWLDNRFCSRKECSLCWARHVCGGACRSESLEFCGAVAQPHAGRCMLMRRLVCEVLVLAATLPREVLLRICPAPDISTPPAAS
ncbi:MAG: radical SAM protein [Candidatus Brocadiia bacterium]